MPIGKGLSIMDEFEVKVKKFIQKHQLLQHGSCVLVGVSGGPDSLALLYFLKRVQKDWNLTITVAHVDHMFRGEESFAEMKYVESICENWNIPFEGKRINVPKAIEEQPGASSEAVARELRYSYFQSVMEKLQIPLLVLAHHGDDQIETILMHLTRGTTKKAASGIQVKRTFAKGLVIRPFLCVTKKEIEEYVHNHQLKPVYDPTNVMDIYTRNRFRKKVLPFLKSENPNVHIHFQRFSEWMTEDENYLMDLAKEAYNKNIVEGHDECEITSIKDFLEVPLPLQRRCIQLILNYLYHSRLPENLSSLHIELIMDLIRKPNPSMEIHLPDEVRVYRSYEKCIFTFSSLSITTYEYEWKRGESITLPNGDRLFMSNDLQENLNRDAYFIMDANTGFPLYVRTRESGDRIQVKGMNGSRKIKKLFIDYKVPKRDRDQWPIVTDCHGNILWVPLLKRSAYEGEYSSNTKPIYLQYIKQSDF